MYQDVSFSDFADAFHDMGRKDHFSYAGLRALYDYLEDYEEGTGEKVQLDVIALCCDYTEYENLKELQENYNNIKSMEDLEDHTQVIKLENSDGFIIQNY